MSVERVLYSIFIFSEINKVFKGTIFLSSLRVSLWHDWNLHQSYRRYKAQSPGEKTRIRNNTVSFAQTQQKTFGSFGKFTFANWTRGWTVNYWNDSTGNYCKVNKALHIFEMWKILETFTISIKVQLFWENHKNLRNLPHGLKIYLVNVQVQTMRKISHIFGAFSEKLNFNTMSTLESGINLAPGINIACGKLDIKNKRSPLKMQNYVVKFKSFKSVIRL